MATIKESGSLSRWNPPLPDGRKAERDISGEYEYSPEAGCPTRYAGGVYKDRAQGGTTREAPARGRIPFLLK